MRRSGNEKKLTEFLEELLVRRGCIEDYKVNRIIGGEQNLLVPNYIPLETQLLNLLSDDERTARRAYEILLDPGIKKIHSKPRESTNARFEFISYLFNTMRHMPVYSDTVDPAHPELGAVSIESLFINSGKINGKALYEAALAEEAASKEFRCAVFLRSTRHFPGSELTQKFIANIGGASGSGKSFASIQVIDEWIKYAPCAGNQGNYVVFVDGGIVRETSIVRELARMAARVLGYSGVKGLDKALDKFDVKEFVKQAAYEAGRFSLVVLETYSNILNRDKTFEELDDKAAARNMAHIYCLTEPPPHLKSEYVDFIVKSATLRAYCTEYGLEKVNSLTLKQNIKPSTETESKKPPKAVSVELGDDGSNAIHAYYMQKHGKGKGAVFKIVTDLMIANDGDDIVRLAERDFKKYLFLVQAQKEKYDRQGVPLSERKYTSLKQWYDKLEKKAPLMLDVSFYNIEDVNVKNFYQLLHAANEVIKQRNVEIDQKQRSELLVMQRPSGIRQSKKSGSSASMLANSSRGSSGSERSSFSHSNTGSLIESSFTPSSSPASRVGTPTPPPRFLPPADVGMIQELEQLAQVMKRPSSYRESAEALAERKTTIANLAHYISYMSKLDMYPDSVKNSMSQQIAQKILILLDAEVMMKGEFKLMVQPWLTMLAQAVPDAEIRNIAFKFIAEEWLKQILVAEDLSGPPLNLNTNQKGEYKIGKLINFACEVYECNLRDIERDTLIQAASKQFVTLCMSSAAPAQVFERNLKVLLNRVYEVLSRDEAKRLFCTMLLVNDLSKKIQLSDGDFIAVVQMQTSLKTHFSGHMKMKDGSYPPVYHQMTDSIINNIHAIHLSELMKFDLKEDKNTISPALVALYDLRNSYLTCFDKDELKLQSVQPFLQNISDRINLYEQKASKLSVSLPNVPNQASSKLPLPEARAGLNPTPPPRKVVGQATTTQVNSATKSRPTPVAPPREQVKQREEVPPPPPPRDTDNEVELNAGQPKLPPRAPANRNPVPAPRNNSASVIPQRPKNYEPRLLHGTGKEVPAKGGSLPLIPKPAPRKK